MLSTDYHHIASLLMGYIRHELSPIQEDQLKAWVSASPENRALFSKVTDEQSLGEMLKEYQEAKEKTWQKIVAKAPELKGEVIKKPVRWQYQAAAVVAVLLGLGLIYFLMSSIIKKSPDNHSNSIATNSFSDIPPGGNKATLLLSNGNQFVLDSLPDGALMNTEGVLINKVPGGRIDYAGNSKVFAAEAYNTLTTPRGGQFEVVLPDGSHVWLNAASSLRYPPAFKDTERKVWLTGEAYFEVAKIPLNPTTGGPTPFIVYIKNKDSVMVLGTHFNIMSYADEPNISTTLLEGSVKFNKALLKPGQQAIANANSITVIDKIDTADAVSWKNGLISFKDADVASIMRKVARWYDVEPVFEGDLPTRKFTGGIPRNSNLSEVLKVLDLNKIHYTLSGKRITIAP